MKLPYLELIPTAHAQQYVDYGTFNSKLGLKSELGNGNLSSIVGYFLPYILTIAGMVLFGMLIFGGFTMLAGAANKESQEKGKGMVTSALTGFAVLFFAYWIAQILQVIFKIGIVTQ